MTERSRFESSLLGQGYSLRQLARYKNGRYKSMPVNRAYEIWQASRRAALEEAANACLVAEPDAATRKALGDAAHYVACAAAIRALAGATET